MPAPALEGDKRPAEAQLEASTLRTSQGRTRDQLNAHLASLPGLGARFGMPVVSRVAGRASHLTFNIGEWNDMPMTEAERFEWDLGEGKGRLDQASLIDPQQHAQPCGGVPLFVAVKRRKGGALCHYAGHWTTASFTRTDEGFVFKDKKRQAIIRLALHHFDEELGAAVDAIEEPNQA